MTVTSVSSSPATYAPAIAPPVRQAIGDVNQAVKSGDLAGAQSAFVNLAKISDFDPNSIYAPAIKDLAQSLFSGDMAGAQDALTSLRDQVLDTRAGSAVEPYDGNGVSTTSSTSELLNITA
jgi:hypothetical protein